MINNVYTVKSGACNENINSTSAFTAAQQFAQLHLEQFQVIPGGKIYPVRSINDSLVQTWSFEAIDYANSMGAVIWVQLWD